MLNYMQKKRRKRVVLRERTSVLSSASEFGVHIVRAAYGMQEGKREKKEKQIGNVRCENYDRTE